MGSYEDYVVDGQVMAVTQSGEEIWYDYKPLVMPDGREVEPWVYAENGSSVDDPINMTLGTIKQLPPSGVITMDDIRQEVSVTGTCNLNQQEFRDLIAPRNSGEQQAMSEYYGKSSVPPYGSGEIGTGGNCFPAPNSTSVNVSGQRLWGTNRALNYAGYCGWENVIQYTTGWYVSFAQWQLPWLCMRDGSESIRIGWKCMNSGYANSNTNYQADGSCKVAVGSPNINDGWSSTQGLDFNAKAGGVGSSGGTIFVGSLTTIGSYNPQCIADDGTINRTPQNTGTCDMEGSFVSLAKIYGTPAGPGYVWYEHRMNWGNQSAGTVRTCFMRMENA